MAANSSEKDEVEDVTLGHEEKLAEVKHWILTEMEWNGRIDNNFIALFLRSCDFDVDQSKKNIWSFYENKRRIPEWWSDRNLNDPLMISAIDINVGPYSNNHLFDPAFKLGTVMLETLLRRPSCQSNGYVYIIDCRDHPWWPVTRVLSPFFIRNLSNSFYFAVPLRVRKIIVLGNSTLYNIIIGIVKHIVSQSLFDNIHLLGSDWSSLPDLVPKEVLPEEYGGEAGPLNDHHDAMMKEIVANYQIFDDDEMAANSTFFQNDAITDNSQLSCLDNNEIYTE